MKRLFSNNLINDMIERLSLDTNNSIVRNALRHLSDYISEEELKRKFKRGDHLVTDRFFYTHHGIYLGAGEVIHYGPKPNRNNYLKDCKIQISSLSDFSRNGGIYKVDYQSDFSVDEIIARAMSRLGEEEYDLIKNNCEHFVNWAIFDKWESKQIDRLLTAASVISAFIFNL